MEERFKTFTVLMANINRNIRRIKTEEMAEFQLKSPHVSCLYYLYKEDGMTAKELCDVCEEDKANISRSIEYLKTNGYLVRQPQDNKKYKNHLALTEKGRQVGERIAEKIDRIIEEAGEGVSEECRDIMYRSLFMINSNLQKRCSAYEK
jgi:DNA-binding MarR family transcriptional regulator